MSAKDTEPDEHGMTWEQVLRDRGYSESVIMDLKEKREAKYRELHIEE